MQCFVFHFPTDAAPVSLGTSPLATFFEVATLTRIRGLGHGLKA